MAVERKFWQSSFDRLPAWLCPTCQSGSPKSLEGSPIPIETELSKSYRHQEEWEPEWIIERFAAFMECQNPRCRDMVVASGHKSHALAYGYGYDGKTTYELVEDLAPARIHPAPPMFALQKNVPKVIRKLLSQAFALFWVDKKSCANRFRTCIEAFLSDQGVPTDKVLHSRLIEYRTQSADIGDMLLSLKYIGNEGSHNSAERIGEEDILHMAEVMEYVCDEVYMNRKSKLLLKAKEVSEKYLSPKGAPSS